MSTTIKKDMNSLRVNSSKTKTLATITIILLLASTVLMTSTMIGKAQTENSQTYCFISVEPNPIGVGQTTLVDFWMTDTTPNSIGATGDFYSGVTVVITKPDRTNQTMGPYTLNSLATGFFDFAPSVEGNYSFQMIYPGNTFEDIGITYLPSRSNVATLVVQQQPVTYLPQTPLPTGYWTRPINGMNYDWSKVSGNWLMAAWNYTGRAFDDGSSFVPEGTSPDSAHILWTKPLAFGGIVGGQFGSIPYYQGASYEQYFQPPVIINGYLYYNTIVAQEPTSVWLDQPHGEINSITCVNMRNGETVFTIPNATLSFGQVYNYVSPNQAGAFAYLWEQLDYGSTWNMYDATTGGKILTIANVPSGNSGTVTVPGADGSILVYTLNYDFETSKYQLSLWNSSKAIPTAPMSYESNGYWLWRPYSWQGLTLDGVGTTDTPFGPVDSNGTEWTVTEPNPSGYGLSISPVYNQGGWFDGNNILAAEIPGGLFGGAWNINSEVGIRVEAYDLATGRFAWNSTIPPPTSLPNDFGNAFEMLFEYNGILFCFEKQTLQWVAWNVKTGEQMWVSKPYTNPWGMYAQAGGEIDAFGMFYAAGFDGEIHAYNDKNGTEVFTFKSAKAGLETPYGVYPFYGGITVTGDGKIFAQTGQHGNGVATLYRGQALYVVDAKTGKSLWNMTGWFNQGALADDMWLTQNNYDNQIYCFGKGPSATTVSAPQTVITQGQSVMIIGTVTDQSPGAKKISESLGSEVAAISDADQEAWMEYLYEQQAMPTNAKGVEVTLDTVDPNGNFIHIGTVTSDTTGAYGIKYTPEVPGTYQIIATFAGSASYYSSYAQTYLGVDQAPVVTAPPAYPQPIDPTMTIVYAVIAIIIAIAIAAIWIKKK